MDLLARMQTFVAVVDAGSFAGAAKRLEIAPAIVTRHVAQLEEHLGARLLNRTTRKLSLTEAGNDYCQRVHQILDLIEDAKNAVSRGSIKPVGTLRVTTPSIFGIHHLDRAAVEFAQRHPGMQIDLSISERIVDLVEEGFDLAIRVAKTIAPGLVARRLAPARIVPCAAPTYLKRHGTPKSPGDLAHHNCLFYSGTTYRNNWLFRRDGDETVVQVAGTMRGNSGAVLLNAALDGLGVIYEPTFLVSEALRQRRLVRLLPQWEGEEYSVFAVYAHRKFLALKTRAFIDFLAERFGPEPYWDASIR